MFAANDEQRKAATAHKKEPRQFVAFRDERRERRMSSFDFAEVLAEYSRAVRLSLISIESLLDVPGIDREKIVALAEAVRQTHKQVTAYIVTLVEASAAVEATSAEQQRPKDERRALAAGNDPE
jgi:hypothetical protein